MSKFDLSHILTCQSFFSEGYSTMSPRTLVRMAAEKGFKTVGLTDLGSVSGVVELHEAAQVAGILPIVGATLPVQFAVQRQPSEDNSWPLTLLARSRQGYAALCELITQLNLGGEPGVALEQLAPHAEHLVCLTGGRAGFPTVLAERRQLARSAALLRLLRTHFRFSLYVQLYHGQAPNERRRLEYLRGLARDLELPVVAAPEVCMAAPEDYPLLDALSCARLGIDVQTPHPERPRNDARHIGTPEGWAAVLPFPDALLNAERIAQECFWSLRPERIALPDTTPPSRTTGSDQDQLEERVLNALGEKYTGEALTQVEARVKQELAIVHELDLAAFFLTAASVTDYCRTHGILAAGRGSAAGSVLCYLLGITLSDPLEHDLLFERFLHAGRSAMPDVDIDIASSRRDQVLAWVEERFGAGGSGEAMVANRITYRLPSAVQDLGRALGLPPELRDRLSRALGRDFRHHRPHRAREAEVVFSEVLGDAPVKEALLSLLERIEPGFVRHLAPHSGGVVLSRKPLTHFSPLTRSSGGIRMLTFDKDDVEKLGLIKLDLLGLRMLAALERAREEALRLTGEWIPYGELPDDPAVWHEIALGDTMALFQVESPAQVQISVKLQPKNMTQLAHQIALIRPGPIQSGTVHPYVRRARGQEAVPEQPEPVKSILASSYGTLMFQEQILRLAVHYAGYSWPEADRFRSRLSKVEDEQELAELRSAFIQGAALTVGAFPDEAGEVFGLCAKFRGYGFAESHAHAFAQHTYASAWMRRHHPAAFLAGVLTEAPGMWPAQTVSREFRRRGVRLLPVCINRSGLSYRTETRQGVRVPLSAVAGLSAQTARRMVQERLIGGKYRSLEDCYDRLDLRREQLEALVQAGAFDTLHAPRREAYYALRVLSQTRASGTRSLLSPRLEAPAFPGLSLNEQMELDLQTKGVTETGRHPLDAHRARLRDLGCAPLAGLKTGQVGWAAGVIAAKQRPPTARGFAFFVLEDPTGRAQAVISPDLWEAHRVLLRDARALIVQGEVTRTGQAVTVRVLSLAELPLSQAGRQAAD